MGVESRRRRVGFEALRRFALLSLLASLPVAGYGLFTCSRHRSLGATSSGLTAALPEPGPVRFLKGQLHLHSSNSSDGHTSPREVARWYQERGYDFIVFTDHDHLTWLGGVEPLLALPGVELTADLSTCDPPAAPGTRCSLHLNALLVDPSRAAGPFPRPDSNRRLDVFTRSLEHAAQLGGLAQVNHPNYLFAADAALLTELARRGALLLEIANQGWDSANPGDATHPSTEALWDAVLTQGQTLYGVASDDAHHYFDADRRQAQGLPVFRGDLGFVMVRARKSAQSIRGALQRGDFYASTGLLLTYLSADAGRLCLEVEEGSLEFIGEAGRVLERPSGKSGCYELQGSSSAYVRAVATDARGRKAWTQPLRRDGAGQ